MENIQENKIKVLTLGTFHFNFPNLDVQKINESNQIDVLEDKYQYEIKQIIDKLVLFKPTAVAIEASPKNQNEINKNYLNFLKKEYTLTCNEYEQIGFRIAEKMNLEKIYCVDEWGDFDAEINNLISSDDKTELNKFSKYVDSNSDNDKMFRTEYIFKTSGILSELRQLNNSENIKKSLGNYLISGFKYESQERDFLGVKFETGRWFNRNLKIFRNIQRIPLNSNDRILIIYGAGHLNLLNIFFDSSPEYELLSTNDYLI